LEVKDGLKIREGEGRHDWLFRMGSKLRGQNGLSGTALLGALAFYNDQVLVPPLEAAEVRHIHASVSQYEPEIRRDDLQESVGLGDIPDLEEAGDLAISLGELLARDMPDFVRTIDGLLNRGEMMVIGGPPNVGKTWVIMDMMVAIATGTQFLEHFKTIRTPILFIDEEGSERGNKARFSMLLEGREDFSADDIPIHAKISSGIRLDAPSGKAAITRLLERYRPGVVFLDSLVRVHGGEENSSRAMADFFRMCKRLMDSYDCSFVFTHHIRKPGSDPGKDDPAYMLRGSGDIQGFPDSVLVCLPTPDSTEMHMYHTKMRHGERLPIFAVGLQIIDRVNGAVPTARLGYREYDPIAHAMKSREQISRVLVPGATMTAEQIAYKLGISLATAKEHLRVLSAGGVIKEQREANHVYYRQANF
jgi:DNA-binding transcriptional ArsR family regulator